MMKVLLVDDEPSASRRMRRLLAAEADIEVVGVAGSVAEARARLAEQRPDAVFLDVEMPGGSAFGLLPDLNASTHVVFVTAHEQHAVDAFAVNAVDYLLKPVDPERLIETTRRLRKLVGAAGAGPAEAERDPVVGEDEAAEEPGATDAALAWENRRLAVPLRAGPAKAVVALSDICWIEALRNYTRVALRNPARIVVFRRRLSEWLPHLPEETFARTSRSELVQLALVEATEWKSPGETIVRFAAGVAPLTLGRIAAARLASLLGK